MRKNNSKGIVVIPIVKAKETGTFTGYEIGSQGIRIYSRTQGDFQVSITGIFFGIDVYIPCGKVAVEGRSICLTYRNIFNNT